MTEFNELNDTDLTQLEENMRRSIVGILAHPAPLDSADGKAAPPVQVFFVKLGLLRNVRAETRRRGMPNEFVDDLLSEADAGA